MDAVKFLKEYNRLCDSFELKPNDCDECPLNEIGCDIMSSSIDIEKVVAVVEQWSKDHPQKTLKEDFLEKYPNAMVDDEGVPRLCACHLGYEEAFKNCDEFTNCKNCWNQPLEDCV